MKNIAVKCLLFMIKGHIFCFVAIFISFGIAASQNLVYENTPFVDRTGEVVNFVWNDTKNIQAAKLVYILANYNSHRYYPEYTEQQWFKHLKNSFDKLALEMKSKKKDRDLQWVLAVKKNNYVVGYLSFYFEDNKSKILFHNIAVLPRERGKGIGTELVFSIFEKYPNIKKLKMLTRKDNIKAKQFFDQIGFKSMPCREKYKDGKLCTYFELNT